LAQDDSPLYAGQKSSFASIAKTVFHILGTKARRFESLNIGKVKGSPSPN